MSCLAAGSWPHNGSRYEFYVGSRAFILSENGFVIPMIFVALLHQWEYLIRPDIIVFLRLINTETTAGQKTKTKRREHSACLRLSSISVLSFKGSGMIWRRRDRKTVKNQKWCINARRQMVSYRHNRIATHIIIIIVTANTIPIQAQIKSRHGGGVYMDMKSLLYLSGYWQLMLPIRWLGKSFP